MSGTQPWINAATTLRSVCGAAALLGLFAMHGLAGHGTAHQGHADSSMPLGSAAGPAYASMTTHHQAHEAPAASTPGDRTPDPGSGLLGLAGMCLAVLLISVVLAVELGRGIPIKARRGPKSRAFGQPRRARRYRDPPCLFALSIQRC
ncbi:hypothetical protein [Nocardioides taihuensis]|jgi:hypothetical protein|uniref:DUF2933 domain-containing protein n=1 Tax=Nocardioides taihuensis TaxID=1835606 RepID=A0ABW0BCV7_9ACTN